METTSRLTNQPTGTTQYEVHSSSKVRIIKPKRWLSNKCYLREIQLKWRRLKVGTIYNIQHNMV